MLVSVSRTQPCGIKKGSYVFNSVMSHPDHRVTYVALRAPLGGSREVIIGWKGLQTCAFLHCEAAYAHTFLVCPRGRALGQNGVAWTGHGTKALGGTEGTVFCIW